MLYTDEESRHIFHQSKTLLQMACQVFERLCHEFHATDPEFIDLLCEDIALLGVAEITEEQAEDLLSRMNELFPRTDEYPTCELSDGDLGLFQIFVTTSEDFANVN